MASINKVILIGHLGKDPEVRYMPSGRAVASVSLATTESWKDKNTGEKQERTEWHNLTFYSPLAEIVERYLQKGSLIYVEGRLQTRKWQDKNGQDRYTTEVIANEMKMLGDKKDRASTPDPAVPPARSAPAVPRNPRHTASMEAQAPIAAGNLDDDIPFSFIRRAREVRPIPGDAIANEQSIQFKNHRPWRIRCTKTTHSNG